MSQHDFNIANQSFPATRTDLNNALVALASNSSGDAEPATKYANQFWYETDTNTLKLRNEANDDWISIAVLDQSGNAVQSITTAGLTLGSTAISATGAEINQLDAITRGSILYGNASGATARLAKGSAGTVLSSDGTDISWAAVAAGGGGTEFISSSGAISNAASVVFTGFDDSKYNNYFFMFNNVIPVASGYSMFCQTSIDSGSNFATTSGDYHHPTNTDTIGMLIAAGVGNNYYGISGRFELYSPTSSANYTYSMTLCPKMDGSERIKAAATTTNTDYLYSARIATEANNAVRFLFTNPATNITSGEISMYGIKKA